MADFDRNGISATFRKLAIEAGEVIMAIYAEAEIAVDHKSDASPVTKADTAADALISAGLRDAFPHIPLITEEQAATHVQRESTFLIVDPLDGTKEFIKRRGDFTVNIALVENEVPTIGVVYAPARKRLFYVAEGGAVEETGDFASDVLGQVKPVRVSEPDNSAIRIVASKSHRSPELETYIERYKVAESVAAGSSLKFCLVAAGEADLYPRLGPTMEWDTAAGHAVLSAAGGEVRRFDDLTPLRYGKDGFLNPYFVAHAPGVELAKG